MAEYIVSARKYRPDSFESLIGQDNIARTLKNSIERGQLAHAYLFCGPRGVGKTSAARIFAKTINCEHPSADMEPCGECESCISFKEGRSYCIHELDAASNNSVDDIKALIDQVNIPPQVGRYSVYIVDEVHMLSQAAFNAFLKTLEEPPAHAIFILATTEKHKILPTILSRCQTYDFARISVSDMVRNLRDIARKEGVKIDDESLHVIAVKADGAMRDALTIFDQTVAFCGKEVEYRDVLSNLGVLGHEHCFELVDSFLAGDYKAALLKFDEILSRGFNALHFVSSLSSHLRNLMVAKSGGLDALLDLPDSLKEKYRAQAAQCPLQFLYEALGITTACETGYKAAINPRLHIEFALMKLSFALAATTPGTTRNTAPEAQAPKQPLAEPVPVKTDSGKTVTRKAKAGQPAAQEQESPASRRRGARIAGMGLSSLKETSDKAEQGRQDDNEGADLTVDDSSLTEAWKELQSDYRDRPRLLSLLSGAKFELSEPEEGVRQLLFFTQNTAQKDWLKEKLISEFENKLRHKLHNSKIRLEVDVLPEDQVEKKILTRAEQAVELMKSNPEVNKLVSDLGLDNA